MVIDKTSPLQQKEGSNLVRILGGVLVFAIALTSVWYIASRIQEHRRMVADHELGLTAQELGSKIEIGHVYFNTGENFLGERVRYLNGTVSNHRDRPLELLELTFTFVDNMGQTVLRESKRPIDEHKAALPPHESRPFSIGFEKMPADWNHQHPSIQITRLRFSK